MRGRDVRAETLYFLVTDRFENGDPDNDFGDDPEGTDPTRSNWLRYWGGDLAGVLAKLDYLAALGVSAIWITPIFEQIDGVRDDDGRLAAPYHGYWTKDFKRIDEHLLPREDWHKPFGVQDTLFDRLLVEAHERGIKLLLDVTCNHTSAGAPGHPKGELYDDGSYLLSYDDDKLGWYNRHGPIRDWNNPREVMKGELRGLADLNEDVYSFRAYMLETMAAWLDRGIDGFRVDAVKHMSLSFWQEFTATMRKRRPDVILFGEWAGIGHWDARGVHFANASGMSLLDFDFQYAVADVLCRGHEWRRLAEVFHHDHVYDDATSLVTFLDNHDMARLLSTGLHPALLPLAVALLMTSRGVPCLFYGTEQYLHDDTNGGGDPYNRPMMRSWGLDTPVARALPKLAALRRRSLAVQRGFTRELVVERDVFAYARGYDGWAVTVVLNRGPERTLELRDVLLPDGEYVDVLGVLGSPVRVERERIERVTVPAGAAIVLEHSPPLPEARTIVLARLNGYKSRYGDRVVIVGDAPELGGWNAERGIPLQYVNGNLWMGDLPFDASAGGDVLYRYVVFDRSGQVHYEDRTPRQRKVPSSGVGEWADRWEI